MDSSGDGELVLERPNVYPNGIAFDAQGRLYWTESMGHRVCRLENGEATTFAQLSDGHVPDGMAFAADGRAFVCTTISGGLTVLSPEGEVLEEIFLGECATNCIFDGPTLYVTSTKVAELGFGQTHRDVLERRDRRHRRPAADSRKALAQTGDALAARDRPLAREQGAQRGERVRRAAGHGGRVAAAYRVQEARDRRDARRHGARDGDRFAGGTAAQLEGRVEVELERGVRGLHVERIERAGLLAAPGDVRSADASAREAQEHRDGVVERARRRPGEREQAAPGSRLDRFDRPGERDLEIDVVAGHLEQEPAAGRRVGEPPAACSRSAARPRSARSCG